MSAGAYSDAARQGAVNSGSETLASVGLDATTWCVDPTSGMPGPNATHLPVNSAVLDVGERSDAFAALPASGIEAAQALEGGREA